MGLGTAKGNFIIDLTWCVNTNYNHVEISRFVFILLIREGYVSKGHNLVEYSGTKCIKNRTLTTFLPIPTAFLVQITCLRPPLLERVQCH